MDEAKIMFEGDKSCELCRKNLGAERGNFGVGINGYTHVFCDKCFNGKKDEIKKMLQSKN